MNFEKTAKDVLQAVGGKENVNSVIHCMTRLRFKLKDATTPNKEHIKQIDGVITVLEGGGQFQVVIGNDVPKVYAELTKLVGNLSEEAPAPEEKKGGLFSRFVDMISGVFMPVMGAVAAAGMLKGILSLLLVLNILTQEMGTYRILYSLADGMFYFFPILLGFSAAKKFGGNPYLSALIGAALVYPDMTKAFTEKTALTFLNIPVVLISYTSSVIPIIIAAFLAAKFEKIITKYIHSSIRMFFVPLLTIIVITPIVFLAVGPIATGASNLLADAALGIYKLSPVIAGFIMAGIWQFIIIFGLHWAFIPILINNILTLGYDPIDAMLFCTTFAQTGAALAIAIKTTDTRLKPIATSASIAGLMGVTEPAIYGVTLPTKKPFVMASIASAFGGAVAGLFAAKKYNFGAGGLFGIPLFINNEGLDTAFWGALSSFAIAFFGAFILTYLFGYKNKAPVAVGVSNNTTPINKNMVITNQSSTPNNIQKTVISPLEGTWIPLSQVKDEAFASGGMGEGVAIIPNEGIVYAPYNGTVHTIFKTKHAIGLISEEGVETLIHIGIDTVKLKGNHFTSFIREGDSIEKGDKLVEFDIEAIKAAGYDTTTSVIISNTGDYDQIEVVKHVQVNKNDTLFMVK